MAEELIVKELDAKKLADDLKKRAMNCSNEEELRIQFAILFNPILESWGIKYAYEKKAPRYTVSGVRKDALYGTVILEFKAPGKLANKRDFESAKEQVKRYIQIEAESPEYYGRYFGVVTDGIHIAFIRYRKGEWEEPESPLEVNAHTVLRLLEAIRGLRRKPLEAHLLLEDFGPQSETSKRVVAVLYRRLLNAKSSRTEMLFEDWRRVFSQVCSYSPDKLKKLVKYYAEAVAGDDEDSKDVNVERLMFALHTYYTILMKLLTSEIITLFADSIIGSYLKRLEEAYLRGPEELLQELSQMEEGGIFAELGIKNFLEADYFAWYLDEWDEDVASVIYDVVKRLIDYEPATVELNPERVEDLFKRLYQNLVPREVRHNLGEYFTPDWLAELVLDEVGYDGNPDARVLDPACGSGTFLVLVIKRIKEYADAHFIDRRSLLGKIVQNVVGVDLNPLAVLAAKANYIIALADLLRYRPRDGIEIPVYLADSIAVGRRVTFVGEREVYLKTVEGELWLPEEVVSTKILGMVLEDIEFCIRNGYSQSEFKSLIQKKYNLSDFAYDSLSRLYLKLLKLEREGKDKIWTRVLKNSFAPLLIGRFDYVVGNPPWINWEHLPAFYREQTKKLWEWYGLTKMLGRGAFKRDMAALFVARSLDRFTKPGGRLAFLVPFTLFKTQAGAGFREFLAMGRREEPQVPCRVVKIHDLVTLYPFEGATNRTALLVVEKQGTTEFPVTCVMWHYPGSRGIDQEATLAEVKRITKRFELVFTPLENNPENPWMQITEKAFDGIKKVIGRSPWYEAHEGVKTALNQVYWVQIISEHPDGLLITNPPLPGQKKKVKQVTQVVEKELVYPLARGRDIKKWYVNSELSHILFPVKNGKTLPPRVLKVEYPLTYEYFQKFFEELIGRKGGFYESKLRIYKELPIEQAEKIGPPFYYLSQITHSLRPYKVVWKAIAGAITGKFTEFATAVLPAEGKPVVPDASLILLPVDSLEEAHYVSAVLNSSIVNLAIASYSYELGGYTHITQNIRIPKFDPQNPLHQKLSELSQKAHDIARKVYEGGREDLEDELRKIEDEIDKTVAKLYGITDEELKEIRRCLYILRNGELPGDEENDEEPTVQEPGTLEVTVEPLLIPANKENTVSVTIQNGADEDLRDVAIQVLLGNDILGKKTLEHVKSGDTVSFTVTVPALQPGEYNLSIVLSAHDKKLKEERTLYVKESRTKQLKSRTTFLDEDFEGLI